MQNEAHMQCCYVLFCQWEKLAKVPAWSTVAVAPRFRSRLPSTTKLSQSTTRYCAAALPAEQWRIRKFRKGGRQLSAPSSLIANAHN